ncbi:MAG TPA: hypothetical protein VLK25_04110 [Allosphingosinicella sp.]|nr:hypothetical protein [Allosphingosinicella sp.]
MTVKQMLMLGCAIGGIAVAAPLTQLDAQAFNATPKTVTGGVIYDRLTPGIETVFVTTDSAIINWTPTNGPFLPAGNTATFANGINNNSFAVLNRILTTTPIRFDGTVLSRIQNLAAGTSDPGGTVVFSSPGGIIVGPTAVFDVGNLILTTLNVVDSSGDFGGTTRNYQFADGAAFPNAAIVTQAGSKITALNQGSYVALIAPRVVHGGSLRANGSIAYVAGETLQMRVNNGLFDIIVSTGSDNATPIIHTGTTGGPSSVAADDVQRIYMVAVPKNQAITAVLEGNVGFDPAVNVGVENGAIVLSAGHSVVGGNVDRFAAASPVPVPGVAASFHIRGGTVTSDLTGTAVTDMLASGQTTGSLLFQQDVSLFADRRAHLFAGTNQNVTVNGTALISAARLDSADKNEIDLTGGEALVFAQSGGTVAINGATTVTAAARGRIGAGGMVGTGTGGTAGIFVDQGNVQLNGNVLVDATGAGGPPPAGSPSGGNGTGGMAFVEGRNGGAVQVMGGLGIDASGAASEASGALAVTGATGLGGTIRLGTTGTAQVTVTGPANFVTDGKGGVVFDGMGNRGGLGRGGDILVTQTGGAITLGAAAMSASGFGGVGPDGGTGQGGTIVFDVANAQFQLNGAGTLAATGTGGDSGLAGGQGGNGQGGSVRFTVRNGGAGARMGTGALDVDVAGRGGRGSGFMIGTPAGDGGGGQGGDIVLLAEAGNAQLDLGALSASADGQGGQGGGADNNFGGGDGGDGRGGTVQVGTIPTAAPTVTGSARFASVDLHANGLGGHGGLGRGTGGDGTGGNATISAGGAPVLIAGTTQLTGNGVGGTGGVDPVGGPPGDDGQATGGAVNLAASGANGTLNAGTVNGTASATGATAPTNTPGHWHVTAGTGGAVNLANLNLTAAANGTVGAPAFSSLEPNGGAINVTGVANLATPGEIRVTASGAGKISGGRYNLNAGTDVTMSHAAPAANGITIDAANLFVVAGDDFSAGAGVVTRTTAQTDIRAADQASVAGRIEGNAILVRSAGLDVAATGAIGTAATVTTDVQATGNAVVNGQIQGQAIILRSAGLNVGTNGVIGGAGTNATDILATGAASVGGQIRGNAIVMRSASLDVAATGGIGTATTATTDVQTAGNANVAGQIQGQAIVLRSAGLDVAGTGAIGAAATATTDVRATGNASIVGQVQGQGIVLRSAGLNIGATGVVGNAGTTSTDILATGAASVAGQVRGITIIFNAASLDLAAGGSIGGGATDLTDIRTAGNAAIAGQVTGRTVRINSAAINVAPSGIVGGAATTQAELHATGAIGVAGRVLGTSILAASSDLDLPAGGAIGDATTQLLTLQPNATGQAVTLGGTTQGVGYTLTGAEAGRIRAGTLRVEAPGVGAGNAVLIRDLTFTGGGAANGIGILEINSPGITRVEGALAMANAAVGNGISINSRERIEVPTSIGSIRVRDGAGAPGGALQLQSSNIWIASPAILAQLAANPNYGARDADLLSSVGNEAERGYVEADRIVLASGGTLFTQNSGPVFSPAYAGITNGPGGLVIRATAPGVNVNAFGRRLNADGTYTVGDAWFFLASYQAGGGAGAPGSFAAGATFNTCIIPTGQCPSRPPGDPVPGRDPTTGPTGGSDSILLPPGAEADDLIDTSFAAEGLIEEPVTSGGDNSLWETDCDRDNDGQCDGGRQ